MNDALMELAERLLLIAADVETMTVVLPPVGQRNIRTRVTELREAATQLRTAASGVGGKVVTDKHLIRFWRNAVIAGLTHKYQETGKGFEEATAYAESDANDQEQAFIDAMETHGYAPLSPPGAEARDAERMDFIERTLKEGGAVWILPSGPDMAFAQVRSFGECDNFPVAEGGARAAIDAAVRAREGSKDPQP